MLTRKHFVALAKQNSGGKSLKVRRKATADSIRFIRNTGGNPRFDRKRFISASNALRPTAKGK